MQIIQWHREYFRIYGTLLQVVYTMIQKIAHQSKEHVEWFIYKNFLIGTRGLQSNPQVV